MGLDFSSDYRVFFVSTKMFQFCFRISVVPVVSAVGHYEQRQRFRVLSWESRNMIAALSGRAV